MHTLLARQPGFQQRFLQETQATVLSGFNSLALVAVSIAAQAAIEANVAPVCNWPVMNNIDSFQLAE
jgi:hypothetical protein